MTNVRELVSLEELCQGSCHCGRVQFEVNLPDGLKDLSRCNCSMCSRRGAIVASVPIDDFRIIKAKMV